MRLITFIADVGRVIIDEVDVGDVEFSISVYVSDPGSYSAKGRLQIDRISQSVAEATVARIISPALGEFLIQTSSAAHGAVEFSVTSKIVALGVQSLGTPPLSQSSP